MAAQAGLSSRREELEQVVRFWNRRLRLQQMALWLPRALLPGLALGIAAAMVSRLRPWLLPGQILLLTTAALLVGLLALVVGIGLWPRPTLAAARRFDRMFDLQERVSTALELLEGRIHSAEELISRQVDDAFAHARAVQPNHLLPLSLRRRDWLAAALLAGALALLLLLPNPQADAIAHSVSQQVAIANAAEELKQIIEALAADTALTAEEREALLEALQDSVKTLEEPGVTPEEAFAELADARTALQDRAAELEQQAQAQQAALAAAAAALQELAAAQDQPPADASPIPTLEELRQNLDQMSREERGSVADRLQQAADALRQTNPQAADALERAADALRQGDLQGARDALQEAADSLNQSADAAQNAQSGAQQLNQSAQSVEQAAQQLDQSAQSGEQPQAAQRPGDPNAQPPSGQQSQQTQPGQQAQPGQEGQQAQPGQAGEQGQQGEPQAGQSGQSGEQGQSGQGQPGQQAQAGQEGQSGAGQQGSGEPQSAQSAQAGQPSLQQAQGAGPGAGDQPGGEGSDDPVGRPGAIPGADQGNNPDGTGRGDLDLIYDPRRIGGQSQDQIVLEPDTSNLPLIEGELSNNPTGSATVPYNQVFSDYRDAANRALSSDYIPLGLRDVVRDYFAALEPRRGQR